MCVILWGEYSSEELEQKIITYRSWANEELREGNTSEANHYNKIADQAEEELKSRAESGTI